MEPELEALLKTWRRLNAEIRGTEEGQARVIAKNKLSEDYEDVFEGAAALLENEFYPTELWLI